MLNVEAVVLWFAFLVPLVFSAGPGNILSAIAGARHGVRKCVPFLVGMSSVYLGYALVVGFGMHRILDRCPGLFAWIRFLGVLFIIYLAYAISRPSQATSDTGDGSYTFSFRDGAISQVFNFKIVTVLALMYSQFLVPNQRELIQVPTLAAGFAGLGLSANIVWCAASAGLLGRWGRGRHAVTRDRVFAIMLVGVALWLALL